MRISKFFISFAGAALLSLVSGHADVFSQQAHAGADAACHFHGKKTAEEKTVLDCAAKRKETLIKKGKIEGSWKDIPHEKIVQVDGKKGKEWLVTFKDPVAKDKSKETLYMYFTLIGNFIAANFSGN
ncbi:MAG: hypothetical protein RI953_2264 [Pseudomonadota bacterium]